MKLKGLNFKKLLVEHGEKIGLVAVGLVILLGFSGARWMSYDGYPSQMTTKVQAGKAQLASWKWPEEDKAQFILKPSETPKEVVNANIYTPYSIADFQFSTKLVRTPYEERPPLQEPKWNTLQDPIANAGRVLIAIVDPEAEKKLEELQQQQQLDPTGNNPNAPQDDETSDEFQSRRPAIGAVEGAPLGVGLRGAAAGHGADDPAGARGGAGGGHGASGGGHGGGGRGKKKPGSRSGGSSLIGGGSGAIPGGMNSESYAEMMSSAMGGMGGMGGMLGYGSGMSASQMGRGFHYVSVRAIFPIRDQLGRVAQATNLSPAMAAQVFEVLDYEIERQTMRITGDPWGGEWEPVDLSVTRDVLEKISIGMEPDVVASQVTDPAITMPLPARISGLWRRDATHPRITKFTLTPEQIQQEREFNELMLQKLQDEQKDLPPPPVQKKGWSDISMSGNSLRSAAFGGAGGSYEDMVAGGGGLGGMNMASMMGSMSMASQYAGRGAAGGHGGGGGAGGGHGGGGMSPTMAGVQGANRQGKNPLEDLLKKAPKERREALTKYITEMATVRGELLLFRYIDFSVEPGHTYRYRVRLTFRNPNFTRKAAEAGNDPSIVAGETRKSDWSEPTAPAHVEKDVRYYVADVKASPSKSFPTPRLNVFQWDTTLGSLQNAALDVALGQTVGGKSRTKVLDPAKSTYEEKDYVFQSTDFAVDALPDISIDSKAHPDIIPLGGASKGELKLNSQVLVATSEGDLAVLDPVSLKVDEEAQKSNYKKQSEIYSHLEQSAPDVGLEGDLGDSAYGAAGAMMEDMRAMYQRGANPLSKKGKTGKGSRRPNVFEQ
jgi:hypothetical protein